MSTATNAISTPPESTLSTPSPTEIPHHDLRLEESTMTTKFKHIYLIVATTPVRTTSGIRLGIGHDGKLPWPSIRSDMDYFKLVTRDGSSSGKLHGLAPANVDSISNTVIMGRKTWSSIPASFRPLSHRINVIITRSKPSEVAQTIKQDLLEQREKVRKLDQTKWQDLERKASADSSGIAAQRLRLANVEALDISGQKDGSSVAIQSEPEGNIPGIIVESDLVAAVEHFAQQDQPGEVFCIGGAEIYGALLRSSLRFYLRILQTEIVKMDGSEFECDTFWPESFESTDWQEVDARELRAWTGIDTPQGTLREWDEDEKIAVKLRVRGWQLKD